MVIFLFFLFFFFNDTATTEIYTLSLHDALPIWAIYQLQDRAEAGEFAPEPLPRSEEHTSELQSRPHLVCRLLLEKKKKFHFASLLLKIKEYNKRNNKIYKSK